MKRRPIEKPVFLAEYAKRHEMSETEVESRFERGEIAGKRIEGRLVLDDRPSVSSSAARISRLSSKLILAGISGYLLWLAAVEFAYPTFRDHAWRHNVAEAIQKAGSLRETVAGRLVARPPGQPVNDGLVIEASGAITEGWVAAEGTIVVTTQLDYPDRLLDRPVTVILEPRLDSRTGRVDWVCGTHVKRSRSWLPSTCRENLALPARP